MSANGNPFERRERNQLWEAQQFLREHPEARAEVAASSFSATAWPDPMPLGDELPPVPAFSSKLLPASFRAYVEDVSERMQAPADFAGAAALVALAGCVNRRAVIQAKRADTSWSVVPNLWGANVGPPGFMKSPVLRAVTLPLLRIEERWRTQYESDLAGFELEKEKVELRWQAWREEYKRATKKSETLPIEPDRSLREPTQPRLVTTDATFEKLHEILRDNAAGILVVRDELVGWLAQFERQGREGERAFYLQAWNGDGSFTIDRIGRGSVHVPAVCVSLLGNIQPARLRWYLSEVFQGGPSDDGLFQRFQILVWPDLPREWKLVDRLPDASALRSAEQAYSALAELSSDAPIRLRFASDAQDLFFAWLPELESRIRGDNLSATLAAHLSKYRSLMPSLAGLFELADRAAASALDAEILISLDHARQAAALCEHLEAHARRVYSCIVSSEMRAAHELARHIQGGDVPELFATRLIYVKGWTGLDTPDRARAALELLEELGWVRREHPPELPGKGRPAELWVVNPRLMQHAE